MKWAGQRSGLAEDSPSLARYFFDAEAAYLGTLGPIRHFIATSYIREVTRGAERLELTPRQRT